MNSSGDPTDKSAYCYDNETKILTDEGWKYFYELTGEERVMVLDSETGEKGWEVPMEYQRFEHEGKMYEIELEEGSNLVVSPKHKIYFRWAVDDEEISLVNKVLLLKDKMIKFFAGGLSKFILII